MNTVIGLAYGPRNGIELSRRWARKYVTIRFTGDNLNLRGSREVFACVGAFRRSDWWLRSQLSIRGTTDFTNSSDSGGPSAKNDPLSIVGVL